MRPSQNQIVLNLMDIKNTNFFSKIPQEVIYVAKTIKEAGFDVYLVGGCVRDLVMDRKPKDWDLTTNAKPEQIIGLFEKTVYENDFGTVVVCVSRETCGTEQQKDVSYETSVTNQKNLSRETKNDVSRETYRKNEQNKVSCETKNNNVSYETINISVSQETSVTNQKNLSRETKNSNVSHETNDNVVSHETNSDILSRETKNDVSRETYFNIEVTPYRLEGKYSDFRHPDEIQFASNIEDDLKRRDFTINAMAFLMDIKNNSIMDIFNGLKDIKEKRLQTVGDPDVRFGEDALRMIRAIRFSCQLGFSISHETSESIMKNGDLIKKISIERIRDEFEKIIMSQNPAIGIVLLQKFKLLKHIIPELEEGIDCEQSGEHIFDVWNHLLHALQHSADKNWSLEVRLSALFHDIGKPRTRRSINPIGKTYGVKKKYTFYGHEVVGARMTKKIMERMKFPKKISELVEKLVRNHMFFSDTEQITLSAVRRIIKNVGADTSFLARQDLSEKELVENSDEKHPIWDLMKVRECDRVGMKKKEAPYRLRKYFAMIEEALHDPISVGALKIDGNILMKELGIKAGPRMGWMLNALLEEVLDDPQKNTKENLTTRVGELNLLTDEELRLLGEKGKEKKEKLEEEEVKKLHSKHGVRK